MKNPYERPGRPSEPAAGSDEASAATTSADYPSLGLLFEKANSPTLEEMRARLRATVQSVESLMRHASKEEAERARRAGRACLAVLKLFDKLEQHRATLVK